MVSRPISLALTGKKGESWVKIQLHKNYIEHTDITTLVLVAYDHTPVPLYYFSS